MEFTYAAYTKMIHILKNNDYSFTGYHKTDNDEKQVILRHDVDFCLEKALQIARLENELGVKSTFFLLISTDFYNVFSKSSSIIVKEISDLGHEIGLHFDEVKYDVRSSTSLEQHVEFERKILGGATGLSIKTVSMHRPSKWILENDVHFDNCINSYSAEFFNKYKYVSDSRMNWRENVFDIIRSGKYNKLHILTHPFWYSAEKVNMKSKLQEFIDFSKHQRVQSMSENFTDLKSVLGEEISI